MELNQATVLDDVTITGLTADSRAVRPGFLFAAIPGTSLDGRDYIDAALRAKLHRYSRDHLGLCPE